MGAQAAGVVVSAPVIACAALPGAGGCEASAAAVGVALAARNDVAAMAGGDGAALVVAVGEEGRRGPTMLAAEGARELEHELRERGAEAAARGRLAWVSVPDDGDWRERAAECVGIGRSRGIPVLLVLPAARWHEALGARELAIGAALVRAELPAQRALCALAVREALACGLRVRVIARAPGRVASRRALAGIDPGGDAGRRAGRVARAFAALAHGRGTGRERAVVALGREHSAGGEAGQALPLVLGGALLLCFCALALAAIGGAATGKSRAQRLADLSALSAARSMRDDFDRLFAPARLPSGAPNPAHLSRSEYLARARAAAREAALRNGADPGRLAIEFRDRESFAPLRVRVAVRAELDLPSAAGRARTRTWAEAEAVPSATPAADGGGGPEIASGGGYSGPLEYRNGEGMRPDVATAFDRMAAAARAAGIAIAVTSGFRSDEEQAALWAANPDPQWVAPPGTSLHRCATELDLGPPDAYGWLAANAPRFGFAMRYPWEPWHFGFVRGPAPCSAAGDRLDGAGKGPGDGASGSVTLPSFVPAAYRGAILRASRRWNVSAELLAAQLMAESNFNPFAVSPAGAAGIAQFMPATAAAYGLHDPFDAPAAIDAQAHLMSDLLRQFDGRIELALAAYNAGPGAVEPCMCVPAIPETQSYVAKILGLMEGAGQLAAPTLEVRLVR